MKFNEAIYEIMPLVDDGDKITPFIISRQNGEWNVNYPKPPEKTQEFIDKIKQTDPFAITMTGYDLAKGSFPYVYDRILNERLRNEYENAVFTNTDLNELKALINLVEENIGEFSSDVVEYITTFDRPLAALYEMTSISLVSDDPDYDYDSEKIGELVDVIENEVDERLRNSKEKGIPKENEKKTESENRNIEGYIETLSIQLAGKYVVLAENQTFLDPYLICNIKYDNPIGMEERYDGIVTDNYVEAMREFVNRVDGLVVQLEAERRVSGLPFQTLTAAEHCISDSYKGDYEGKLVVIKPEILAPEYRSAEHQLALCTGGFGASAEGHGRAVFVNELFSGNAKRYDRTHIAGLANPQKIPNWALDKLLEHLKKDRISTENVNLEELSRLDKGKTETKKKPTLQEKLDNAKEKVQEANAAKNDNRGDKSKKRNERE